MNGWWMRKPCAAMWRRQVVLGGMGLLCAGWVNAAQGVATVSIQGAGATFPAKVYARWVSRFQQTYPQVRIAYAPTGSGDGVKQAAARTAQFAGTDSPLGPQALADKGLVQVPMLVGGLVPVVNLQGVGAHKLLLTGEVLADIMLGKLVHWDEAPIARLNPGLNLPHLPIRRVVRADASGTSEALTRYLGMASAEFAARVPASPAPNWPGQVLSGKGMDGMLAALKAAPGGIAYVAYDRVVSDQLAAVRLRGAAGRDLSASEEGFRAAILDSDVYRQGEDTATLLQRPRPDAWPLTMTSYLLLDARPKDQTQADWTAHFVYWCFMHGDELLKGTGFAPLPQRVQAKLSGRLTQIHGPLGDVPKYIQP
ncbi:phosphate ABC transporter substrate-binding protein PstS [Aquabacterium sp.]|uniref:phosphate ABC transporter substrate-binding protein PstS n=1 Tax=Aquabacterium sp. TaxID=1872578 RepID=UPI0025C0536B|nr:phosphate ABC transporter substrate-binding protein PstS [Aquabacterium sp.]